MKLAVLLITLLITAVNTSFADDQIRPYVSLETGYSWAHIDSGGFNTGGNFTNTNDDTDSSFLLGARAGVKYKRMSSDISFTYRDSFDYITDSFAPPTPIYFYKSDVTVKNIMLSGYYDFFTYEKLTFFAGAGLGVSFIEIETDDTVVIGDGNDNDFAWQAEVGIEYPLAENLIINTSYVYVDLGDANIDLTSKSFLNTPAGNFEADLTANEFRFGVRYLF